MAWRMENEVTRFVCFKAQVRIAAETYSTNAVAAKPPRKNAPTVIEPACQTAKPSKTARHATPKIHFVQSSFEIFTLFSSRSSSLGLIPRIWSSGRVENSSEIRTPKMTP